MHASVACARQIRPLFDAMIAGDTARVSEVRREIDRLEHEADHIKNEIRAHLPKRMLLAIERRDMLEILDCQDSMADVTQDIAGLADLRSMTVPESLREPLSELVDRTLAACEQAERVIDELDELVETGFRGRGVDKVVEMIDALGRIESETDVLEERVASKLFALEDELGIGTFF